MSYRTAAPEQACDARPQQETDFGYLNGTLSRADLLVERVLALADTLVGTRPTPPPADGKIREALNGLFPAIGNMARQTDARLSDALDALDRITRALP